MRRSPPLLALLALGALLGGCPDTGSQTPTSAVVTPTPSATATLPSQPSIQVAPEAVSFGAVLLGAQGSATVQVSNAGGGALQVVPSISDDGGGGDRRPDPHHQRRVPAHGGRPPGRLRGDRR